MTRDSIRYYALGRATDGAVHAAASVFGPAVCAAVVELVDDKRRFTDRQAVSLDICPRCRESLLAVAARGDHSAA